MPAPRDLGTRRDPQAGRANQARSRTRWTPVDQLPALARALLSDDLGGRDVVPQHVADRVTRQAGEWAAQGFTEETVGPWKDAPPAAAGYLASRGVDPAVLDLPVNALPGAAPVALRVAITSGRMPVERAYELLVLTGQHLPAQPFGPAPGQISATKASSGQAPSPIAAPTQTAASGPVAAEPSVPVKPPPVAPVIFSHASTDA